MKPVYYVDFVAQFGNIKEVKRKSQSRYLVEVATLNIVSFMLGVFFTWLLFQ